MNQGRICFCTNSVEHLKYMFENCANVWWQYNDHAHDLLAYTYIYFCWNQLFYDIWFICNCILMAIMLTWCLFICQVSSCPPLQCMGVQQGEQLAISRSHAHIAIVSFRLHRMYTHVQLPILSIYVLGWMTKFSSHRGTLSMCN